MEQTLCSPAALGTSHGSSSPHSSYAFLNHSTTTLPHNLPPSVDNKSLARQKRRRTSPEDQATLESAYQSNPKPDRTARLELVKQVALGEKEVQIWFQNRRQSSRRKSRPLLPHEIAQYHMSRSAFPSPTTPADIPSQGFSDDDAEAAPLDCTIESRGNAPPSFESHEYKSDLREEPISPEELAVEREECIQKGGFPASEKTGPDAGHTGCLYSSEAHPSIAQLGYLANRRNTAPSRPCDSGHVGAGYDTSATASAPVHTLKKSASCVRLSMTSEGNARVVTKDNSLPSPPRTMQVAHILNTTADAEAFAVVQVDPALPKSTPRLGSGRSRDSRAWEFWCDKDTRSELEEKAEKDNRGSAADAIGLMRSNSGRVALGAMPGKRNALVSHQDVGVKRSKLDHRIPGLQRSHISQGRLQGKTLHRTSSMHKLESTESAVSVHIPGNRSDKENWSPRNEETADPENDPELAAFMGGDRRSSNVTQPDEMDCVQGLLFLSQGAWR